MSKRGSLRLERFSSPSSFLPPMKSIPNLDAKTAYNLVSELYRIYTPSFNDTNDFVEGVVVSDAASTAASSVAQTPRRRFVDSGYASAFASDDEDDEIVATTLDKAVDSLLSQEARDEIEEANQIVRQDAFERKFAWAWLTRFVSLAEWIEEAETDEAYREREAVVEHASGLLAACSNNTGGGGPTTREYLFTAKPNTPLYDILPELHVRLTDQELPTQDHTAVGLITWGGSCILAERFLNDPETFNLLVSNHPSSGSFRILELGGGTGLLSIVVAKILEAQLDNARSLKYDIHATDYHPSVLANLEANLPLNFDDMPENVSLTASTLDWRHPPTLEESAKYDLVIGGDLIYHVDHPPMIKHCLKHVLKRESLFWMIGVERSTHMAEIHGVENVFFKDQQGQDGVLVRGLTEEKVERQRGIGRADETRYRIWSIGWK